MYMKVDSNDLCIIYIQALLITSITNFYFIEIIYSERDLQDTLIKCGPIVITT